MKRLSISALVRPVLLGLGLSALPLACGSDKVKSPFGPGAGGAGGEAGESSSAGFRLVIDGGDELDPTLGGPCEDDGQCDDEVDCTRDRCDGELGRCRFEPDDTRCDDQVYCDGAERCDVRMGCVEGDVVACSDNSTCTIDVCEEETQSCRHDPRDADGDGDPVRNCGGGDCADDDPRVSSRASEVCDNGRDDDCDGSTDESDCAAPEHDTCDAALQVVEPGFYDLDLTATGFDYPTDCANRDVPYRDVVFEVTLPEGGPYDLDVTAKTDFGRLLLGSGAECGQTEGECAESYTRSGLGVSAGLACSHEAKQDERACGQREAYACLSARDAEDLQAAFEGGCSSSSAITGAVFGLCCPAPEASVARLLLRDVAPGTYPIYLAGDEERTAQVQVAWRPAEAHPGELCEEAVALEANGAAVALRLPAYGTDRFTACAAVRPRVGDAFVAFTLAEPQDVTLVAETQNDLGLALVSLLDASCSVESTCRRSQPGRLFERGLPAGEYRALISGTAPDDVAVRLETAPVSATPAGEGCDNALSLQRGVERVVDLAAHEDAVDTGCLAGAPDAAFELTLEEPRDVMLIGRFSDGDTGALSLATSSCSSNSACSVGGGRGRIVSYGLPAGTHRVVAESARGNPVAVSYLERAPASLTVVPFAENCDAPVTIPEGGGRFRGNTRNAFPDFDAGCDVGGQSVGGAPDQLLKLSLSVPRRVVLDMRGSEYDTMLSVRRGEFCPGEELPMACAAGYWSTRSFLDLELQAGTYFVQIDGFDGKSGPWRLEVFTSAL